MLLRGFVLTDLYPLEEALHHGCQGRRALDTDDLALEQRLELVGSCLGCGKIGADVKNLVVGHLCEGRIFGNKEGAWGASIRPREIDGFQPFIGNLHPGHDGIVLAGAECRNNAVPVLGYDLTLDFHPRAKLGNEIDLEAFELAAGTSEVPGGICTLGGDLHGFPSLCLWEGTACGRKKPQGCNSEYLKTLHGAAPV